jgi:hypothetical protein
VKNTQLLYSFVHFAYFKTLLFFATSLLSDKEAYIFFIMVDIKAEEPASAG